MAADAKEKKPINFGQYLGGIGVGTAGGTAALIGRDMAREAARPDFWTGKVPSLATRIARRAGGAGLMIAGGATLLGGLAVAAKADEAKPKPEGGTMAKGDSAVDRASNAIAGGAGMVIAQKMMHDAARLGTAKRLLMKGGAIGIGAAGALALGDALLRPSAAKADDGKAEKPKPPGESEPALAIAAAGVLLANKHGRAALMTGARDIAHLASSGGKLLARVAGRAFLPVAIATTAYDAFNGYKKGGVSGAIANVATLGLYAETAVADDGKAKPKREVGKQKGRDISIIERVASGGVGALAIGHGSEMIAAGRLASRAGGLGLMVGGAALVAHGLSDSAQAEAPKRVRDRVQVGIERGHYTNGMVRGRDASKGLKPRASLSTADKKKYAAAAEKQAANRNIAAAKAPKSDGMTDAHVRYQRGKTVKVTAFKTPERRT